MTLNPKFQITGNTMNSIAEIERIKGLLQGWVWGQTLLIAFII